MYRCAAKLLRDLAARIPGKHRMDLVAQAPQLRDAPTADEATGSADQHAPCVRHTPSGASPPGESAPGASPPGASSSGQAASRAEITVGATGHAMPNAGSFQRSPRLNCGACAAEIM